MIEMKSRRAIALLRRKIDRYRTRADTWEGSEDGLDMCMQDIQALEMGVAAIDRDRQMDKAIACLRELAAHAFHDATELHYACKRARRIIEEYDAATGAGDAPDA